MSIVILKVKVIAAFIIYKITFWLISQIVKFTYGKIKFGIYKSISTDILKYFYTKANISENSTFLHKFCLTIFFMLITFIPIIDIIKEILLLHCSVLILLQIIIFCLISIRFILINGEYFYNNYPKSSLLALLILYIGTFACVSALVDIYMITVLKMDIARLLNPAPVDDRSSSKGKGNNGKGNNDNPKNDNSDSEAVKNLSDTEPGVDYRAQVHRKTPNTSTIKIIDKKDPSGDSLQVFRDLHPRGGKNPRVYRSSTTTGVNEKGEQVEYKCVECVVRNTAIQEDAVWLHLQGLWNALSWDHRLNFSKGKTFERDDVKGKIYKDDQ